MSQNAPAFSPGVELASRTTTFITCPSIALLSAFHFVVAAEHGDFLCANQRQDSITRT